MGAYEDIDPKIAGQSQELPNRVISKRCAENAGIGFGYPLFGYVGNDEDVFLYHKNQATVLFDGDLVTDNDIDITVDGVAVTTVPFNGTHNQTMDDIVTQIEADIEGAVVELTDIGGDNRTFTINIEDDVDRLVTAVVTGGGGQAGATITYQSTQILKGVALRTSKEHAPRLDLEGNTLEAGTDYVYKDELNCLIEGLITSVIENAAVESGTQVYVITSGDDQGKFSVTLTDNVEAIGWTFEESNDGSTELADIRVPDVRLT